MTVEITEIDFIYAGDGIQTAFPTPFFMHDTDIVAVLRQVAGPGNPLELGVHYTLTGAGNKLGGTLTIIDPGSVPGAVGMLVIVTDAPEDQRRSFPRVGSIDNREYERSLDKLSMLVQELNRWNERSIRAPIIDLAGDMLLPLEYLRVNRVLAFDGTGLPVCLSYEMLADLLLPFITGVGARTGLLTIEDLGLAADGVTNDTPALNAASDLWSSRGGATFFLRAHPGGGFRLDAPFNVRSGINVIWGGGPIVLTGTGCVRIAGDVSVQEAAAYAISVPALTGANQIFVDPAEGGSGDVSTFFPPGTRIQLAGDVHNAELQVVGSDQFRITISPNLPFDTDASDRIRIIDQSVITSNIVAGAVVVPVASIAPFALRDWVIVEDDMVCGDAVAGASTSMRIHCEILQVIGISGLSLTFNRRLEHNFSTAFNARVVRMEPVRRASVSGGSVTYDQGQAGVPAAFDMIRAVDCEMVDCEVPNDGTLGADGSAFRFYQSCNSRFIRPKARNPQSSLPGIHGGEARLSTGCTFVEPEFSGYRHNLVFRESATRCHAVDAMLNDDRNTSVLFAGADEVGCTVSLRSLTGGSQQAGDITAKVALKFGLDTCLVGPTGCVVEDGRVTQYDSYAVRFVPGALNCKVRDVTMAKIATLLWHEDSPTNGLAVASGCGVDCAVDGWTGRLVDVEGKLHGALVPTLKDFAMRVRATGGSKFIHLSQFDGMDIRVELANGTVDVTEPWAIDASDGARLSIKRCDIADVRSGITLTRCPSAVVVFNDFERFSGGTVWFNDGGNNDNSLLAYNVNNFNGTTTVSGTPSPGLTSTIPVLIT